MQSDPHKISIIVTILIFYHNERSIFDWSPVSPIRKEKREKGFPL